MAIRDLTDHTGLIVSGLRAPIAVVSAPPRVRARTRAALERRDGVVVIDAPAVVGRLEHEREQLKALRAETLARQEAKVAEMRQARHEAGEGLARAYADVESALSSLDEYDRAEKELAFALAKRDDATAAEAVEARRLAAVLERRERLMRQRADALRAIEELEAEGPVRRSAQMRLQVAQLEAGLSRAEEEQTRAERTAEANLQQARATRLAATTELTRADGAVRGDLPGFPGVTAEDWPPGPPLPVLLAERRDRLAAVLVERYNATSTARAALDRAGDALRAAERELEGARRGAVSVVVGSALDSLLRVGSAGDHTGKVEVVVLDEPFAGVGAGDVAQVVERLVRGGTGQVVYLTDDPEVLSWAGGLAPELGGITIAAPETPVPESTASESPPLPGPAPVAAHPAGFTHADRSAS